MEKTSTEFKKTRVKNMTNFRDNLYRVFRCPSCKGELTQKENNLVCRNCLMLFPVVNEIPIILKSKEYFLVKWNKFANKLHGWAIERDTEGSDPLDVDMRVLKAVKFFADTKKDSIILDVGCGEGSLLRLLSNLGYNNLIGVEISLERLSYAKNKSNGDIIYIASDDLCIFEDESLDTVVSTAVIEHLENPEKFIKECNRILKPSGYLIITTDCYMFRIEKALGLYKSIQPIDNAIFPTTIIKMAKQNNFKVLHYDAWGTPWFHLYFCITNTISNILPKFIKKPLTSLYECGLTKAVDLEKEREKFKIEAIPKKISKLATLKCIFLIGDVFYLQKLPKGGT